MGKKLLPHTVGRKKFLLQEIPISRADTSEGYFPYDGYDRCDRWKKRSAIVAIMWKPLVRNRNEHSNHMEISLY